MKLVRFIIITITITYSLLLSAAVGPMRNADKGLRAFQAQSSLQIDQIRSLLVSFVELLQRQQKEAETQKNDLIKKQQLIDTSNKELVNSRQEIGKNKLLPKDVKDPLNDMFTSSAELITQMNNIVVKGIETTQNVQKLVPDAITKIQNVVKDIDTYAKVFKEGIAVAIAALKPLVEAEIVADKATKAIKQAIEQSGKNIEQTAQQAGKAIEQTGQQVGQALQQAPGQIGQTAQQAGKAIEQTAQQAGQAITQTAQQAGQAINQAAQQTGQAVQQAPAKIEQGLKDFGKLLGIG